MAFPRRTHTHPRHGITHFLERQHEGTILSCVEILQVRNESLAQAAGASGRICVACSTDGAATWRATSHCMSVAVHEKAARGGCKELQNSGTLALVLGFHAGLLRQAALFKKRSEWVLKQLLAGDTCLRQSASSHQVGSDQQLDKEKLQLR